MNIKMCLEGNIIMKKTVLLTFSVKNHLTLKKHLCVLFMKIWKSHLKSRSRVLLSLTSGPKLSISLVSGDWRHGLFSLSFTLLKYWIRASFLFFKKSCIDIDIIVQHYLNHKLIFYEFPVIEKTRLSAGSFSTQPENETNSPAACRGHVQEIYQLWHFQISNSP